MMPTPCQPHWTGIKGLIIIAAVRSGVKIGAGAVESHLFLCYSAPRAEVAQLAEHSPEKAGVDSSILSLGTIYQVLTRNRKHGPSLSPSHYGHYKACTEFY